MQEVWSIYKLSMEIYADDLMAACCCHCQYRLHALLQHPPYREATNRFSQEKVPRTEYDEGHRIPLASGGRFSLPNRILSWHRLGNTPHHLG